MIILLGLLFVAVTTLWIMGKDMHEIKTEIEIAAPPEKVWEALSDINTWQDWSPIINKSSGVAQVGSKVDITMMGKEKGQDGPQYSPEITQLEEAKYFHWRAKMMAGFIFTNDKVFELEKTATGTKLIHKELFKGLMLPLMCGQLDKNVPGMLDSMNQALKKLVEN